MAERQPPKSAQLRKLERMLADSTDESERAQLTTMIQQLHRVEQQTAKKLAKIADRKRKDDTRRKIIAGGIVLEYVMKDEALAPRLIALFNEHVMERDQHLFADLKTPDLSPEASAKEHIEGG